MARKPHLVLAALILTALVAVPTGASAGASLSGTFASTFKKKDPPQCADVQGFCGTLQLAGYGDATFVYEFGALFEPDPEHPGCFDEDGTITITVESDGSTLTGDVLGTFCFRFADQGTKGQAKSYGNPFDEIDSVTFTDGTGRFDDMSGTGTFRQRSAGARYAGTLTATLS